MTTLPDCDLAVVGLGPAGVACVLQARREGLSVMAFEEERVGGLLHVARRIDNLPGSPAVSGRTLANRMQRQVRLSGAYVFDERIEEIRLVAGGGFFVESDFDRVWSRTVCVATGTIPVNLPVNLYGCNLYRRNLGQLGRLRRGCSAVVIGGGDAAFDSALSLADRGAAVTILMRGARPKASPVLVAEAAARRILIRRDAVVRDSWSRESSLPHLELEDGELLTPDVVMICIGREPRLDVVSGLVADGVPCTVETRIPGLYMAGDVIRDRERFVASAIGDGQQAALLAARFIREAAS
jgi:thioredoxin reductase (NADPH)